MIQLVSALVRRVRAFGVKRSWSSMASPGEGGDGGGGADGVEQQPWKECLGQAEATELDNSLFFEYEYSIDQLMEIAGLCVAQVHTS